MVNIVNFRDISTTPGNNEQVAGFSIAEGVGTVSDFNDAMRNMLSIIRTALPSGIISMWSGTISEIPDGWYLCDGTNGTPDLRDRFVVGASDGADPGGTGGASTQTLSVGNLPAHTHTVNPPSTVTTSGGSHSHSASSAGSGSHGHAGSISSAGAHTHTTGSAGSHQHNFGVGTSSNTQLAGAGDRAVDARTNGSGDSIGTTSSTGAHTHTISSDGAHTHNLSIVGVNDHTHTITVSSGGTHSHTVDIAQFNSGSAGSGVGFDNRPAYYAVAFIMLR